MKALINFFLLGSFVATYPAFGRDDNAFLIVRDLPRSFSVPDSAVTDILGLDIGMPRQEAKSIMGRLMGEGRSCCSGARHEVGTGVGQVKVSRMYEQYATTTIFELEGSGESLHVFFTPELIGARVVAVNRRVLAESARYKSAVEFGQFERAILTKYGVPSTSWKSELTFRPAREYVWLWGSAGKIDLANISLDKSYLFDSKPGLERCAAHIGELARKLPAAAYYKDNLVDPYEGCNTGLRIRIVSSQVAGRVESAEFSLVDFRRYFEQYRAVKAFFDVELKKAIDSTPKKRPPL